MSIRVSTSKLVVRDGAAPLLAAAVLAVGGLAAVHSARAEPPLPAEHRQGPVAWVSGGVTSDEAAAFKAAGRGYSLVIEMAEKTGGQNAFVADARVSVLRADGTSVLEARSDGPFMLVRLPAGSYKVQAVLKGRTIESKPVNVTAKSSQHVMLLFPEGTG